MTHEEVFFIEPAPSGEYRLSLNQQMMKDGFRLSCVDKRIFALQEARHLLLEKGITAILTSQQLNEEVLPDNTPRNAVLDTLKYKIEQCRPSQSVLLIDPYLFPSLPDSDYITDFLQIFKNSLERCSRLEIATKPDRNTSLENQVLSQVLQINPSIVVSQKYTNSFHDRFWIADEARGVFVGTSLNGVGKRYAVVDWLQENDAIEIVQRYRRLP
jgi:hypothetical protein